MYQTESNRIEELKKIIENSNIRIVFQPILSLKNGEILGYEALSRGPVGSFFENPLNLFNFAKEHDMLFQLEKVAREKALQAARNIGPNLKIFINVDPHVIYDKTFKSGVTRNYLKDLSLSEKNIVIELTERTFIEDFKAFKLSLDHYREQGFNIAIDDTGAGYSGLQSIVSLPFDFIKIDRSLVSDIDIDPVKQALLEAFIKFSRRINSRIIAEGIETREELEILIDLGVDYGQGFVIARPNNILRKKFVIQEFIKEKNTKDQTRLDSSQIGEIALIDVTVQADTETGKVVQVFENNEHIQSVIIVNCNKPVGIVMRDKLYYRLGTKYGYAVYMDRPVKLIMNDNPMIVDYKTAIYDVSQMVVAREQTNIYDSIIVIRDGEYYGSVSIKSLLEQVSRLQIEEAKQRNPLTDLPGNPVIEHEINIRLKQNRKFSVLYLDLDNFKPYNDCYGYKMGDKIIILSSEILLKSIEGLGNTDDFIGHIGGDDFVIITTPDRDLEISKYIINMFDNCIKEYLNNNDKNRGYYVCSDRQGCLSKIPLTAISIAIVSNENSSFENHLQISDIAAEVKKIAKEKEGSSFVKESGDNKEVMVHGI